MGIINDASRNALIGFLSVIGFFILLVGFFFLIVWISKYVNWADVFGKIIGRIFNG